MGWTGFNGGDPYAASIDASLAVLNTHICAATSLLTWLLLDILFFEKPSVIGATQGMITGLVCITPAAGKIILYTTSKKKVIITTILIVELYGLNRIGARLGSHYYGANVRVHSMVHYDGSPQENMATETGGRHHGSFPHPRRGR